MARKFIKKKSLMSVNIPFLVLEEAIIKAREIIKEKDLCADQIGCNFVLDGSATFKFSCVCEKETKLHLKDCFGGYKNDSECTNCFLATACELVCQEYIEETGEDPLHDEEKSTAIIPVEPVKEETSPSVFGWRRSKSTGNLCGAAFFKSHLVKITIFPSKFKEDKFTLCISSDEEEAKPEFKDGFESEDEAKKYIESMFKR